MSRSYGVTAGLIGLAALAAQPAAAQPARGDVPDLPQLIDQLNPATRGIRMPSQQPAPGPTPQAPETTAPAGMPAASLTVRFATGSATLTPQAEQTLEVLGRALTSPQLVAYRFRIEGHTDTVGSAPSNQALSERRAAAVRDYLASRFGVNPARLDVMGMGESQLLVPTPDEAAEARNRRVQVLNLGS